MGDRYGTDRCTVLTVVRSRVIGTWFVVGRREIGTGDRCTLLTVVRNRVVGTWFVERRRDIGTMLNLVL